MSALLVLHAPGDAAGGAPWREALVGAGWEGLVAAPDLAGHGLTPPPVGGHHELAQPAFDAPRLMAEAGIQGQRPIVIGIGAHGFAAQLLALGGRASGLVLVDGIGGPWRPATDAVVDARHRLRALADDQVALAHHLGPGLDPRLAYGPHPHGSRALALRVADAVTVPTLVVESSASPLPVGDRDDVLAAWSGPVDLHLVQTASPDVVARLVVAWAVRHHQAGHTT